MKLKLKICETTGSGSVL